MPLFPWLLLCRPPGWRTITFRWVTHCVTVLLCYCITVLLLCYHYALNLTHHHPAQRGDNCTFRNCNCSFHSTVLNTQLCASRIIVRIGGRARFVVLSHISLWSLATSTRVAARTMRTLLIMSPFCCATKRFDLIHIQHLIYIQERFTAQKMHQTAKRILLSGPTSTGCHFLSYLMHLIFILSYAPD